MGPLDHNSTQGNTLYYLREKVLGQLPLVSTPALTLSTQANWTSHLMFLYLDVLIFEKKKKKMTLVFTS